MQHHHTKKSNWKKNLLILLLLVVFGILGYKYFFTSTPSVPGDTKVIATTTPVVNKPKPVSVPSLVIAPSFVQQGDPALIIARGITSTSSVKSFTYNNRPLIMFLYDGEVTALLGVDLNSVAGTFPLVLTLKDGRVLRTEFVVNQRPTVQKQFDIPEKLGGNTYQSVRTLISTLAVEGKIINAIPTSNNKLWTEKFRYPLNIPIVVEDPYGYTRLISNFTMPHKGTDLQAPMGTSVYAMNKGIVRFAGSLRNYGQTILVDHGAGLQTVYMHLSDMSVTNGQAVEKGQLIGMSGDTGYSLNPHLHVTVRIWDISIDPMKFMEILGEN